MQSKSKILIVTGFGKTLCKGSAHDSRNASFYYLRLKFIKVQILLYTCRTTLLTIAVVYGG